MAGILAFPAVLSAQSQVSTNATRLPEIVVVGRTNAPALTVPSAAAAKTELQQVPGGTDVIPAESFLTGRAATMKDVLEYSPGVFVQPRFGSDEARLSIRGSGLQRTFHGRGLKLLQDGVPLNLADGGFDMQAVEPLATSYVEVLRGANALRYGSTTLGGAINYVAPTGYDSDRIRLRAEAGSFGYYRSMASSGMVLGKTDYFASVSQYAADGFRTQSQQNAQRVFSNIGHRFNENVETRLYFTYVQTRSELPGNLTKAQLESNPEQANAGNLAGNQQRNFELVRVASKTTWTQDEHQIDFSAFWSHKDLFHPIFQVVDQNSNDGGIDLRYRNNADRFGRRNLLTVGLSPTLGAVEDGRYVNVAGNRGAKVGDSVQRNHNLDFYIEDQHWLTERWSMIAGMQVSQAHRQYHDTFTHVLPDFDYDYLGLSPKAGFIFEYQPQWQFYGNLSRSFEPPSVSELGVISGVLVDREAQTGWTLELGTRGERDWFSWDLSWYYGLLDNELLSFETAPNVFATINASTTVHQGVELGTTVRLFRDLLTKGTAEEPGDSVSWHTAYQWNDFRFRDDATFGDNQLPGIPSHFLKSELVYQHSCGFYAGPNVEWSPVKYPVDMANTLFADPYALLGIKAGYRTKKGFSAFVEVRNLTDKRYAATTGVITRPTVANQAQFLPGDGRAFYGGIEWRW